jgi:hypothetical protein
LKGEKSVEVKKELAAAIAPAEEAELDEEEEGADGFEEEAGFGDGFGDDGEDDDADEDGFGGGFAEDEEEGTGGFGDAVDEEEEEATGFD